MGEVEWIRKRDGKVVRFEPRKITSAILKALASCGREDRDLAEGLSRDVIRLLEKRFMGGVVPGVEDVQDIVEEVLLGGRYWNAARNFILYRERRRSLREAKRVFGVKDELKLSVSAINVLQRRYLLKDEEGKIIETPAQMFARVAREIAKAEYAFGGKKDVERSEAEFYELLCSLEFLPNSPTLMNAGTRIAQLSACFVIPIEDSINAIFDGLHEMAIIHQSGGGTGFSFSNLRPEGDCVRSTSGIASGPVSFIRVFDVATEVIRQGGRRRGANMGILRVDHPDILNFIRAKDQEGVLNNFNLSIAVTDRFMEAVERDEDFPLINPRTKDVTRVIKARTIFDLAAASAWNGGDPGIIFIDEVNRGNPTPSLGPIESTNPCGEQPLLPYESCNLGSINLSRMLKDGAVDWEKLERVVVTSVRFLDNVIERTNFPNPKISKITKANRKIGLGVMGFSDMLAQLKVCYDSTEAVDMAERLMKFISSKARETSVELGRRRGSFQNFDKSIWMERGFPAMRNASLTAIAPTGTISIIANTSSGIEPFFGVVFVRNVLGGTQFLEVNPVFEYEARKGGFLTDGLLAEIARRGSTKDVEGVPPDIQKLFQTSFEVAPSRQLEIQAAFQRYTDSSVSKTINIPSSATIDDVKEIFLLAYKLKCKGITVYRYGSRKDQALYFGRSKEKAESLEYMNVYGEYSGGCLRRECLF